MKYWVTHEAPIQPGWTDPQDDNQVQVDFNEPLGEDCPGKCSECPLGACKYDDETGLLIE
jgi:hypothetical protein